MLNPSPRRHDIYKWHADQRREALRPPRSKSVVVPRKASDRHPAFDHIHEPGGFRRNYVLLNAPHHSERPAVSNNFVEFLYLYGHLAGEDLEESDEDETPADDETYLPAEDGRQLPSTSPDHLHRRHVTLDAAEGEEGQPLLHKVSTTQSVTRSLSRMRRRSSITRRGDATFTQAVLMLLKGFIGTGVLFLGRAFYNGGMLFSTVTLVFIAMVSLYSFILLGEAKAAVPGSFGSIGGQLYGKWMRLAILASIVLSQVGFVAAYTIFVAENLQVSRVLRATVYCYLNRASGICTRRHRLQAQHQGPIPHPGTARRLHALRARPEPGQAVNHCTRCRCVHLRWIGAHYSHVPAHRSC